MFSQNQSDTRFFSELHPNLTRLYILRLWHHKLTENNSVFHSFVLAQTSSSADQTSTPSVSLTAIKMYGHAPHRHCTLFRKRLAAPDNIVWELYDLHYTHRSVRDWQPSVTQYENLWHALYRHCTLLHRRLAALCNSVWELMTCTIQTLYTASQEAGSPL